MNFRLETDCSLLWSQSHFHDHPEEVIELYGALCGASLVQAAGIASRTFRIDIPGKNMEIATVNRHLLTTTIVLAALVLRQQVLQAESAGICRRHKTTKPRVAKRTLGDRSQHPPKTPKGFYKIAASISNPYFLHKRRNSF